MKTLVAIVITLVLTACSPNLAHRAPGNKFIVVFDEGGWIESYQKQVEGFIRTGTNVEIRGLCASACTMYLGVPNVCVHPTSELMFHGSIPVLAEETKDEGDETMSQHYTPELKQWYNRNAKHLQFVFKSLSGQELHDMFGYDLCEVY